MKPGGSMSCREFAKRVPAFLDGALAEAELERFEAHSRVCADCHAYLVELRLVVDATGRLRGAPTGKADPARNGTVELFRSRGWHAQGAHVRDVPLGIGERSAALGDHIAYLWESERDFMATVGYLATGLNREEVCVVLGRDQTNRRVLERLDDLGLNTSDLRRHDRLHVASPSSSSDDVLRAVDDRVKAAVDRGLVGVRVLADVGWGTPGWPSDHEMLRLEARVTSALRRLPCIALCAYDAGRLASSTALKLGLQCHPTILRRDSLMPNREYVPDERFLASLDTDREPE